MNIEHKFTREQHREFSEYVELVQKTRPDSFNMSTHTSSFRMDRAGTVTITTDEPVFSVFALLIRLNVRPNL